MKKIKHFLKIALISFLPPFFIYLPFILKIKNLLFLNINKDGMLNIYRNWDGPSYLVVAKSFYNPKIITKLLFSPLPATYFSAHFPLYPLLIKITSFIFPLTQAGIIVNLIAGFFLNLFFFEFIKNRTKNPYFLTFVFTILPARSFVTRVIIAPETLLSFFTLLSVISFRKKQYLKASLFLTAALLTKFQIIILAFAYGFVFIKQFIEDKKINLLVQKAVFLAISAIAVLILFYFFELKFGNFWAYFEAQNTNDLTISLPFSQFNSKATWIKSIWLEDLIFYYLLGFMLVFKVYEQRKKKMETFLFSTFYLLFLAFLPQRDITRFSFPLMPFFFETFSSLFEKKYVKLAILSTLPAIFFYTLNFILGNQAPITNWAPFLY